MLAKRAMNDYDSGKKSFSHPLRMQHLSLIYSSSSLQLPLLPLSALIGNSFHLPLILSYLCDLLSLCPLSVLGPLHNSSSLVFSSLGKSPVSSTPLLPPICHNLSLYPPSLFSATRLPTLAAPPSRQVVCMQHALIPVDTCSRPPFGFHNCLLSTHTHTHTVKASSKMLQ